MENLTQFGDTSQVEIVQKKYVRELAFDEDDLRRFEMPVTMGQRKFILREALHGQVKAWRNYQARSSRFTADGKFAGVGNIADADSYLLAACTVELMPDGTERQVTQEEIAHSKTGWKEKVVRPMLTTLKEVSGIKDEEEESEEYLVNKIEELQSKLDKVRQGHSPLKNGQ